MIVIPCANPAIATDPEAAFLIPPAPTRRVIAPQLLASRATAMGQGLANIHRIVEESGVVQALNNAAVMVLASAHCACVPDALYRALKEEEGVQKHGF